MRNQIIVAVFAAALAAPIAAQAQVVNAASGDPLLGAAAPQPEHLTVAPDQLDGLVRPDPAQRTAAFGHQHQAGVARQVTGLLAVQAAAGVQLLDVGPGHGQLGHAHPAGVGGQPAPVLLGRQADRRRLDPQRQVLADQHHVVTFSREIGRDGEDAGVVVRPPEASRQPSAVGVVQFDLAHAAQVIEGQLGVQPAVLYAQLVEEAQRLAGEVPQLGMVALGLQLGDDDEWQNHQVLVEPAESARVGEQNAGVEHVRADLARPPSGRASAAARLADRRGDWLIAGLLRTTANRGTGHAISLGCLDRHPARSLCPERRALP